MKTTFKIKGIGLYGEGTVTHKVKIEHPEFKVKKGVLKIRDKELPYTISVESQIMDWMDNRDNGYLLDDLDLHCILDYSIHVPKKRKSFKVYLAEKLQGQQEGLVDDLLVTYKEMKDLLKGLSYEKKLLLILRSAGIGYKASAEAVSSLSEYNRQVHANLSALSKSDNNIKKLD